MYGVRFTVMIESRGVEIICFCSTLFVLWLNQESQGLASWLEGRYVKVRPFDGLRSRTAVSALSCIEESWPFHTVTDSADTEVSHPRHKQKPMPFIDIPRACLRDVDQRLLLAPGSS